jgi:hypothetical protein
MPTGAQLSWFDGRLMVGAGGCSSLPQPHASFPGQVPCHLLCMWLNNRLCTDCAQPAACCQLLQHTMVQGIVHVFPSPSQPFHRPSAITSQAPP